MALERELATHGIDAVLSDVGGWPWNPLAGRGTVLQGIDPLRALRTVLRQREIDVVVAIFESPALLPVLARRLGLLRVPVVVWDLGLTETWRLRERILNKVVPEADAILVLSASQRDYIAGRWGRDSCVAVVGHRVDTEFFRPAPACPNGPALSVGDDVGRDFPSLLAVAPQLEANIVLKTRAIPTTTALPANVTVRRERIDGHALRELYAASRFVVVPLGEALNASGVSTILEAGAMGRALVVSDLPAIRDFVVPNETCLMVPRGDRPALLAAMRRLASEPETCARLGANARRFVVDTCAEAVFASRFAAALRRVAP
jgi:glycosyltransferase involved in cell wall biosynthesis